MAIRKPFEIPLREVQKRMALENPWWVAGAGIDPEQRGCRDALISGRSCGWCGGWRLTARWY